MMMIDFLNRIRKPVTIPISQKLLYSLSILLAGIISGTLSKILDTTAGNLLPPFLESLDLRNFFSRIGIWIFFAVLISIYSKNPFRAAANVFSFFIGMISSYYLYTIFVAGFLPKSYMMIWIIVTFISPFMAFICWYAKGKGIISIIIAASILMLITRQTFVFGFWYLYIKNGLELFLWTGTMLILYQSPQQIAKVVASGTLAFLLASPLNLLWGML